MSVNAEKETQTEILKEGGSLVKLENEVQMQISIQRPRNEKKILESALAELDLYKSCADEALYVKPVGKKDGVMQFADSLSIRAAENLSNRWDNSAYGCDMVADDDDYTTLAGVFLDYERNIRRVLLKRVSKSYTSKDKRTIRYSPDRFDLKIAAEQSKLLREVILRALPAGLKKEYENKAWQLLETGDREKKLIKIKRMFEQYSIKEEELKQLLGTPLNKASNKDLVRIGGIYNALKDREITKESLFENKEQEQPTESKLKIQDTEKPFPEWILDKKTEFVKSNELESFNTTLAYLGVEDPEKLSQIKDTKLQEKIIKHFALKGEQSELK